MAKKKETAPEAENTELHEETAAETAVPDPTQALTAELEREKDKYLRLCAEYDNFRKRTQKEKEAIWSDATAKTVEALLPVIDNLERAVEAAKTSEELESFKKGVELTLRQFLDILQHQEVTEIEALGKPFDPNLHHAVMHVEDEQVEQSLVTEVFQKGYRIGERVIRPAMVKVTN